MKWVTVQSVGEALERLDWRPQCVILDVVLPDESGLAVLKKIRSESLTVQVAVVTGLPNAAENPEIFKLKPDGLFIKPVDVYALSGWLASVKPE